VTQKPKRRPRPAVDEGASYTKLVMEEVKILAEQKGWSDRQLAEEMDKVGIPWSRDTVTNLMTGRRKRLAAHELLGLCYVLDVSNPVDLIVPAHLREPYMILVPKLIVPNAAVRAWFEGKTGPLREWLAPTPDEELKAQAMAEKLRAVGTDEFMIEQIITLVTGQRPAE